MHSSRTCTVCRRILYRLKWARVSKIVIDVDAEKQHPNLESECEDLKYALNEKHDRERHVEVGQSVAVDLICLVFTSRVKLNTTTPHK